MDRQSLAPLIERLKANPEKFVDFMMKFELNLEKPDPRRSWASINAGDYDIACFLAISALPSVWSIFATHIVVRQQQISALTIGLSYFFGGLIPLLPYAYARNAVHGLLYSCIITFICLLAFGYVKSYFVAPERAGWNAMHTALVGAAAAGTAYATVYFFKEE
jgi:hypothetical protein